MLSLDLSTKFRKDFKRCQKQHLDLELLKTVINTLRIPATLDPKYKDHPLHSQYEGCGECHIAPDWLLIYRTTGSGLYIIRTGTHADLFYK